MADREGFLRSVFRVLRPGGRFVLSNIDPWSMPDWTIHRFFPESREQDLHDCWPAETLRDLLVAIGFVGVHVERHHFRPTETLGDALAYVLDRHRTSQLMVISDEAYVAGLERLREAIAADGAEASIESEVCLMRVIADRPRRG